MLDAIACYMLQEQRLWNALRAIGHDQAEIDPPAELEQQLENLQNGGGSTIGTPEDPFVFWSGDGRWIASYYIDVVNGVPDVQVSGSAEFLAAYNLSAQIDDARRVH